MPLWLFFSSSLAHHVHNAVFVHAYPNMPGWLTAGHVLGAWGAVTAVGVGGYLLLRRGLRLPGLATLALYAVLGLYGLAHYGVAPMSAHTLAMHLTIWAEVLTALLLLAVAAALVMREWRATP